MILYYQPHFPTEAYKMLHVIINGFWMNDTNNRKCTHTFLMVSTCKEKLVTSGNYGCQVLLLLFTWSTQKRMLVFQKVFSSSANAMPFLLSMVSRKKIFACCTVKVWKSKYIFTWSIFLPTITYKCAFVISNYRYLVHSFYQGNPTSSFCSHLEFKLGTLKLKTVAA